jgi:hypothetical protein
MEMNRKEFLLGVLAASMLSVIGASSASAAGQQGINPECSNRYAICPPRLKAKEKPDWKGVKRVRKNKISNARPARRMKRRR